jgi:hypothetical protein
MIQVNELRIGNLLQGKIIVQVDAILRNKQVRLIGSESAFDVESKNPCVLPIPLTEKILEQCGFENNKTHFTNWINEYKCFILASNKNGYFICDCDIDSNLTYLHELQNIYFAFTKQELPINIDTLEI